MKQIVQYQMLIFAFYSTVGKFKLFGNFEWKKNQGMEIEPLPP